MGDSSMLDMTLDEMMTKKPGKGGKGGKPKASQQKKKSVVSNLDGPLKVIRDRRKGSGKGQRVKGKGKGKGKGSKGDGRWILVNSYKVQGVKKKGKKQFGQKIGGKGKPKEAASNGFNKQKLEMSLEDVIKKERPGGKGGSGANKKVIKTIGKKVKGRGKGQRKGKSGPVAQMSRKALSRAKAWAAWGGFRGGKGKGKGKGKAKGSKGKGKDRPRQSNAWSKVSAVAENRRRALRSQEKGKGKGKQWPSLRSEKGKGRDYGGGGKGSDRAWSSGGSRGREADNWGGGGKGRSSAWERGRSRERISSDDWGSDRRRAPETQRSRSVGGQGGATTIKVSGIPRGLDWRDIKDAFQDAAGRVTKCDMEGSTAWLSFTSTRDAQKAVKTFDHGELNGKTITVVLMD